MLKPSRPFVFGCLSGAVITFVLVVGGTLAGTYLLKDWVVLHLSKELKVPPITLGLKADYDWGVTAPDGQAFSMAETRGKVVFLSFWQTDCPHCLSEIPALNQLYQMVQGEGIAVLGVAFNDKDGPSAQDVAQARDREGIQFPVYALKGKRPEVYQSPSSPTAFIIASNGDIMFKHTGAAKWDDERVISFLRMLAQKAPEEH